MLNIQETKAEENKSSATVSDRTEEIDEASAIAEAKEETAMGTEESITGKTLLLIYNNCSVLMKGGIAEICIFVYFFTTVLSDVKLCDILLNKSYLTLNRSIDYIGCEVMRLRLRKDYHEKRFILRYCHCGMRCGRIVYCLTSSGRTENSYAVKGGFGKL